MNTRHLEIGEPLGSRGNERVMQLHDEVCEQEVQLLRLYLERCLRLCVQVRIQFLLCDQSKVEHAEHIHVQFSAEKIGPCTSGTVG